MPRYRIRTAGAVSVGAAVGIGITGFEIQDLGSRLVQGYTFGAGGAGASYTLMTGTILSDWTEFDAPIGLGAFGGIVVLTDVNWAKAGKSRMYWTYGPAADAKVDIDTSGWEISIPGGSVQLGWMTRSGNPVKEIDTGREARYVTVAIWHPLYPKGQRYIHWRDWAAYWGRLDLNMEDFSGLTSATPNASNWTWQWTPKIPQKHLPVELMKEAGGKWHMPSGVAYLRGPMDIDLTGLGAVILADSEKVEIHSNDATHLLGGAQDSADSNGTVSGGQGRYPIVWMVTGFRLIPR